MGKAKCHLRKLAEILKVTKADRNAEQNAQIRKLIPTLRKWNNLPVSTLEDFIAVQFLRDNGWNGEMILKPAIVSTVAVSAREWALQSNIRVNDQSAHPQRPSARLQRTTGNSGKNRKNRKLRRSRRLAQA